jgi:DNA repair exonuclease SbcCD nuclease subunit
VARPLLSLLADAHLDIGAWVGRPIVGDSMFAFEYAITYSLEKKVDHIIGAGDLIDVRRPPSEVISFLRDQLARLDGTQVFFHFIQGQHDLAEPPWFQAVNPAATYWLHEKLHRMGDFSVYGLDWTPADRLAEKLAGIPGKADIVVCHQVWEEFMGDITSPEGSLTQIPNARTVFTGDYHSYQVLRPDESKMRGAQNQPLTVYSPGATCLRKIDETNDHFLLVMYDDGTIKRKRIPSRPVYTMVITTNLDVEKHVARWKKFNKEPDPELPEKLQHPLLHVTYPDDMPEARSRIENAYGNLAHIFWKAKRQETEEVVQRRMAGRELRAKGPAGCLHLVVPEKDPRHAPLLRLLSAEGEQKAELVTMKKERGL